MEVKSLDEQIQETKDKFIKLVWELIIDADLKQIDDKNYAISEETWSKIADASFDLEGLEMDKKFGVFDPIKNERVKL